MGVRGYEATADGSDFDENWTEDIAKATGRVTNVGLYPDVGASYIIFKVDATYHRRDGSTGVVDDSNADAATLINAALGDLTAARTWRETVTIKGDITTTVPIELPSFTVLDLYGARITLADNADCNIIENADQTLGNTMMMIQGGVLDGNYANTASGHGVFVDNNNVDMQGGGPTYLLADVMVMQDVAVTEVRENAFHFDLNTSNTVKMTNCDSRVNIGGKGLYLVASDGWIANCGFQSWGEAMHVVGGSTNSFHDIYCGGTGGGAVSTGLVYLDNTRGNEFVNLRVDHFTKHGLILDGDGGSVWNLSNYNQFVNLRVSSSQQLDADNTYSGVVLNANTSNNSFCNSYIGKRVVDAGGFSGDGLKYGIEEKAGTDYNHFVHVDVSNVETAGMVIVGANDVFTRNPGYVTENAGTGSILNTATSDVIAHGCDYTPVRAEITVTLGENPTVSPGAIWVDTIGAANFTVNCEVDPGASNLDFSWSVHRVSVL